MRKPAGTDTVRFILNGELHQVQAPAPTLTVLTYLRESLGLCGTKEGCAEGDCGACTTVLVDLAGDQLRVRPMNACIQLLPTLDGKALWTVEGLASQQEKLHPVQQALIQCHGSQCGFCTPGFVMSLFALYKTQTAPSRQKVKQSIAGNLCRCTGYRPIIDAAQAMYDIARATEKTHWKDYPCSDTQADEVLGTLRDIQREEALDYSASALAGSLETGGQRYVAPLSIDALADTLQQSPEGTLLAGGTDIGLWLTKHYRDLESIIYLGQVNGLDRIEWTDNELVIGAAANLDDAFASIAQEFGELDELVRRFASPPICSTGTLAGNVANGSPIGDSMPALICLGAEVDLQLGKRRRRVALDNFYLGYQQNALEKGEFVRAVCVPRRGPGVRLACYKWSKRFDQDISAVCAAFAVRLEDNRAADIRICYGGMAAIPKRAEHAEKAMTGKPWSETTIEAGMQALRQDYQPITDMRASCEYRALAAENLMMKFYLESRSQADSGRVFGLHAINE